MTYHLRQRLQTENNTDPNEEHHHQRSSHKDNTTATTKTRRRTKPQRTATASTQQNGEWILLRLVFVSLLLLVASATILMVWLIFFPQDAPSDTHMNLFSLRTSSSSSITGSSNSGNGNNRIQQQQPEQQQPPLLSSDLKVSVVIMNHNRPRLLQQSRLLPTLLAHPNVDEILLAHSNPQTQFDYYQDYYDHPTIDHGNTSNKIININATQANQEMGLALRFHYCAQQARNEWVMMVDDDQEMTSEAISRLIWLFSSLSSNSSSTTTSDSSNNSSTSTLLDDDNDMDANQINNIRHLPYNPHVIVGRYGRVYHEPFTWWSWYHASNHGYDTRTYTGRVEVVLTKFLLMHRTTCRAFFEYQPLVWRDLIRPTPPSSQQHEQHGPLWNGEDIFMSLVANHLYQKHQLQQQQSQSHDSKDNNIIVPYSNYATSSLNVWETPAVDEVDTDAVLSTTTTTTTGSSGNTGNAHANSKTGISGNMDRHILFWNVGWTEYWQIKARARAHIHYRGLLWFTARQRLAALLLSS